MKWVKWDFPNDGECLTDRILSYFYLLGDSFNSTHPLLDDQYQMTLKECQHFCENMVNFYGARGCFGIIVDEVYPGKCWIPDQSMSYSMDYYTYTPTMNQNGFWPIVNPEIGNCRGGVCGWCNNTYQLKYWNLSSDQIDMKREEL